MTERQGYLVKCDWQWQKLAITWYQNGKFYVEKCLEHKAINFSLTILVEYEIATFER